MPRQKSTVLYSYFTCLLCFSCSHKTRRSSNTRQRVILTSIPNHSASFHAIKVFPHYVIVSQEQVYKYAANRILYACTYGVHTVRNCSCLCEQLGVRSTFCLVLGVVSAPTTSLQCGFLLHTEHCEKVQDVNLTPPHGTRIQKGTTKFRVRVWPCFLNEVTVVRKCNAS